MKSAIAEVGETLPAVLKPGRQGTLTTTQTAPMMLGSPTLHTVPSWAEHTPSLGLITALEGHQQESLFALEFSDLMILRFHYFQVL